MIGYAQWDMRGQLAQIWQVCFQEPRRSANYFFNNIFHPQNCLVFQSGGKPAAMLHMLPVSVVMPGSAPPAQAQYVYACATLPEHQGHGFMTALLAAAALEGTKRGDCCSILLPATRGLYPFYEKNGYSVYFSYEMWELTRFQLGEAAAQKEQRNILYRPEMLCQIRKTQLGGLPGSMLSAEQLVWMAVNGNARKGGKLLCTQGGFALVRESGGTCHVREWAAPPEATPALLRLILQETRADSFSFRLPRGTRFPVGSPSSVFRCGVAKPLGEGLPPVGEERPYLGFTMDE